MDACGEEPGAAAEFDSAVQRGVVGQVPPIVHRAVPGVRAGWPPRGREGSNGVAVSGILALCPSGSFARRLEGVTLPSHYLIIMVMQA